MSNKKGSVLILGANSDIAKALARIYASNGFDLCLAAREIEGLQAFAADLTTRSEISVELVTLDIRDTATHYSGYHDLNQTPTGVISVVGYLGDQTDAQSNWEEARRIIDTNFTGLVSYLNIVAEDFEHRKEGFIVGISSVAGDRGRQSNYLYGSAKAAFSAYLSGLRNRLASSGISVLTVKPGFVATKMTKGMDLPPILTAQPEKVAGAIYNSQQKRHNVLYTLWIWRWIMLVIRHIPESIFKKLTL